MQFKYLLLALTSQCALATALETFSFLDGTPIDFDTATSQVEAAFAPDAPENENAGRLSSPAGPKMLEARGCPAGYPLPCPNYSWCCATGNTCCEGRTCLNPNTQNCCRGGYWCRKPSQCVIENATGELKCLWP